MEKKRDVVRENQKNLLNPNRWGEPHIKLELLHLWGKGSQGWGTEWQNDSLGFRQVQFEEPTECKCPSGTKDSELQLERHGGPGGNVGVSSTLTQDLAMVWGGSSSYSSAGVAHLSLGSRMPPTLPLAPVSTTAAGPMPWGRRKPLAATDTKTSELPALHTSCQI